MTSNSRYDDNAFLLHGDPAIATFSMLERSFTDLIPIIDKAKSYSRSDSPMLIEASAGPELEMLAQAVHNESSRKQGPFIIISISGMSAEQQEITLFGNPRLGSRGAILDANHGTLMIQGIDKLTMPLQSKLARVIRSKRIINNQDFSKYKYVDIRIIASTSKNLTDLRRHFLFRSDLLFTLKALRIRIPKLKDRKTDIQNMLDFYISDFNKQYGTNHTLSDAAREKILNYSWDGNVAQLQAFCERMILTANSRIIHSSYIDELLSELYIEDSGIYDDQDTSDLIKDLAGAYSTGSVSSGNAIPATNMFSDQKLASPVNSTPGFTDLYRDLIVATLKKNNGSRKRTAEELKISPSTLWRKMQKYHIDL